MFQSLKQCTADYLYAFLREQLFPRVRASLEIAEAGQRIRITTLPGPVMESLCEALQNDDRWVALVLPSEQSNPTRSWEATATKLIELRNTLTSTRSSYPSRPASGTAACGLFRHRDVSRTQPF